jgi:hypothetical protein
MTGHGDTYGLKSSVNLFDGWKASDIFTDRETVRMSMGRCLVGLLSMGAIYSFPM